MDFAQYWQYTDIVTKTLFFILLGLSLASWIVGILRLVASRRLVQQISHGLTTHVEQQITPTRLAALSTDSKKSIIEQMLLQQLNRYRFDSEKGLSVLGTTAAIAPFIGLFGTVWGIFHALHSIAQSGQAGLGQVAGPVGEALIMTGLGLAVAIPAVLLYNIAVRINRKALHLANDTAHGLLAQALLAQDQLAHDQSAHDQLASATGSDHPASVAKSTSNLTVTDRNSASILPNAANA